MNNYTRRRKHLMQLMGNDSIAILPACETKTRNNDVEYPYRPDSDFYYLTGFNEPDAVMVLLPGQRAGKFLLFCRRYDPHMALWNGTMAGLKGACNKFGADAAYAIEDIDAILPGLLENRKKIFYTLGNLADFDSHLTTWLNQLRGKARSGITTPQEIIALEQFTHEMRLFKDPYEIKAMRRAAHIAAHAHNRAMRFCQPDQMEYQLEAEILHEFMSHDCREPAYPSIVAGGANSCTLHYTENNCKINNGELILIDAGAEYKSYASDITRTFPVNGVFNPAQKALYELVLKAQLAAIDKVKPGNNWNDPHLAAVRILTRGLLKLGLLKGDYRQLIKDKAYERFYMHRTGHWLGMDVHDVGNYKINGNWRIFASGMTLTVEPGLYIPAGSRGVAKKWWDIGIRIEDDILVTHDGCEVLSHHAVKTVTEIEALMATA